MNEYLWEFAQKLPNENGFQMVLKSALALTASKGADIDKTNDKWMCRKCKTLWMHGYFRAGEVSRGKQSKRKTISTVPASSNTYFVNLELDSWDEQATAKKGHQ
ncbi:uncharacterized protein LOC129744032 isoform X2 [Uranotaenia lowii]|uniref:uncharacterized protein LOC129744032 isoform X2 n=1 Tax=Uranotaenia lowii TaxID=190385 RepID=UPI002479A6F7|nr:uncharacterized protein LOC129744032 isoform X2 [Uranotaenia lowii]